MKERHIETLERRLAAAQAVIEDLKQQRNQMQSEVVDLRRQLEISERNRKWFSKEQVKAASASHFWLGKFAIVKHENNKLRQRLWRQTREKKDEPQVPPAGL